MANLVFFLIGITFIILNLIIGYFLYTAKNYVIRLICGTMLSLTMAGHWYFIQEFLEITNPATPIIATIETFYTISITFFAPLAGITFFLLFYYAMRVIFFPKKRNDKLW